MREMLKKLFIIGLILFTFGGLGLFGYAILKGTSNDSGREEFVTACSKDFKSYECQLAWRTGKLPK